MIDIEDNEQTGYHAGSSEFLMLNKEERRLVEAILRNTMKSETGRQVLKEVLGNEYVEIGLRLLRQMTGGC